MIPMLLMALQAAQKIGQAQNENINQFNAQQRPIVNGQQQTMVQNPKMNSIPFTSIYNALTDDDDEWKKNKNTIGM
jgi:hypothetical protein